MSLEVLLQQTIQAAVEEAVRPLREDLARLRESLSARPAPVDEDALLSTSQAAELMGVRPATVRQWIDEGRLTPHGSQRAIRVSRRELLALRPDRDGAEVISLEQRAEAILRRTR